ncbi:MAG: hypothetical protein II333_10110 [Clostridia bacterium]|nr:hypothetical protein [Clostridia bacterium]
MTYFELKDLRTQLHVALSEAVMSRIRVTEDEVKAFQTVHHVLSQIEPEDGRLFEGEEEK